MDPPTNEEELSNLVTRLLKLQCVFMFEKEIETLKHRGILHEVSEYVQNSKVINFHRILLTIVKCFTEKYFDGVKRELLRALKKVPYALGPEGLNAGTKILNTCLVVLEKRMFENLYHELNEQPLHYLTIFNMFNLDFVKSQERYRVFLERVPKVKLQEGHTDETFVSIKCINIFDLIKYVYYNAIINAKITLSKRIFTGFIEENVFQELRRGKYVEDPCEKFAKRTKKRVKTASDNKRTAVDTQLDVVEYLIKEMWNTMPDLKNPIHLEKEEFENQLSRIMDEPEDDNGSIYDDDEEIEKTNWDYIVTRDGETLYLNAPSYKYFGDFRPGWARTYEYKPNLTEADFTVSVNRMKKCHKLDYFDLKMDRILFEGRQLVGEELGPERGKSKNERIMSYFKTRKRVKKKQILHNEMWNQFYKKYFTFGEDEADVSKEKSCNIAIRPQEFYDQVPRYQCGAVAPIQFEFDEFKYICAACGFFIEKGTGVQALGYKWHSQHFKCRICCESFTEPAEFILFRGIVVCMYDAKNMFNITSSSRKLNRKW